MHWQQEDHRPYHQYYSHPPDGSQIETYDPWAILDMLRSGAISLSEAEDKAIVLVQVRAYELQRPNMVTDPWGRTRKQSKCTVQVIWKVFDAFLSAKNMAGMYCISCYYDPESILHMRYNRVLARYVRMIQ